MTSYHCTRFLLFSTRVVRLRSRSPVSSVRLKTRCVYPQHLRVRELTHSVQLNLRQWLESEGHEFIVSGGV